MHRTILSLALALACTAALSAAAADLPSTPGKTVEANGPPPPKRTIYLYESSLDELRTTDPLHYAQAAKILAAAPQLCRFDGTGSVVPVADASDVHCLRSLIKTSLPPKWELRFRLDDVQFIALVTVKGLNPKLIPAR